MEVQYEVRGLDNAGCITPGGQCLRITGAAPCQIGSAGGHDPGRATSRPTGTGSADSDRRRTTAGAPSGTCTSSATSSGCAGQAGNNRCRNAQDTRARTTASANTAGRPNGQDPRLGHP